MLNSRGKQNMPELFQREPFEIFLGKIQLETPFKMQYRVF
jgi:hypothetical protein